MLILNFYITSINSFSIVIPIYRYVIFFFFLSIIYNPINFVIGYMFSLYSIPIRKCKKKFNYNMIEYYNII